MSKTRHLEYGGILRGLDRILLHIAQLDAAGFIDVHTLRNSYATLMSRYEAEVTTCNNINLQQRQIHANKSSCDIIRSRSAAAIFRIILDKTPKRD